ncbi:MAG: phosphoglycerate dehydrogenase [candidate division NC10 bacterium]|nr:phosphoglycerate dehydrogenase [candidate division NC10 bacterium]MBI2114746.1 phosphoglycerate dehydrogenase [candidate division NC10 bacterium]MBI2163398.1 phosphoglycerate dehydrogenase [candidate division NC10 bacterium]MBI3121507.1 phosphoglycerate dehydrogenase [candidate division NC10 bacterium]
MDRKPKILVTVQQLADREAPELRPLEEAGFEILLNRKGRPLTEQELIDSLPGVFATVAGGEPYTARVLEQATDLRVVARFGVGYDQIDVPAATRHGVAVAMAFGTNHESVADYTLALMLALAVDLVAHHEQVKGGRWITDFHRGFWRATVGIVGLGRIGKAVARRCQGFETRILAYDPVPDTTFACDHGVHLVPLDALLREADFVTLHLPLTAETVRFINRDRLALMRPTAFLINTARGAIVDEEALAEALTAGRLAGAGLDAFAVEPPFGSPLLTLDRVIVSPHAAGSDERATAAMLTRCVDSILAVARGDDPGPGLVLNPEVLTRERSPS